VFLSGVLIVPAIVFAGNAADLMNQNLEDLLNMPVTSATLKTTTQKVSPGNPYIITSDEMDKMGVISIADALDKMVPGINIAMYPNFNELVTVRGIATDSNLKTMLLTDGLDIGDHTVNGFAGGDIDTPLMGDIDRLEVMLGPGSLQLGSGAINGYINRISSTGTSKPGLRINQVYGSGNARMTELSFGKVQNADLNWFIYGGYYRNDGVAVHENLSQQDIVDHGGASNNYTQGGVNSFAPSDTYDDHVKFGETGNDFRFSSRLQYNNPDRGDLLSFDVKSFYSDTSTATSGIDTPFTTPASGQWIDEVKATLTDLNYPGGGWGYSPFFLYRSQMVSFAPETHVVFNAANNVDLVPYYQRIVQYSYPSSWFKDQVSALGIDTTQYPLKNLSFGYQSRYGIKGVYNNTSIEHNDISIGEEYRHIDFRANDDWEGQDDNMLAYLSTNQVWDQYSLFGEDVITFGKLTVTPGLRYDVLDQGPMSSQSGEIPSEKDYHLTPRLAGAYQLTDNDTLKGSYAEGVRFVDSDIRQWFYDHNYTGALDVNGQSVVQPNKLLPEVSKDYEITYDKYIPEVKIKCDITTYYDIIRHARGWVDLLNNYVNAGKDIQGVGQEYMIKYLPSNKMEVFLAYGWSRPLNSFETQVNVANHNDTWTKYPQQMFKAGASYTWGKFTFGTMMKLTDGAYVHDEVTDPTAEALYSGWTLDGDVNVKYALTKNADVKLTVKDLIVSNFNQYYNYWQGQFPAMGLRSQDPRIYVSLDYRF